MGLLWKGDRDGASRVLLRLVMLRKKEQARELIYWSVQDEIHCCLNYRQEKKIIGRNVYKDIV